MRKIFCHTNGGLASYDSCRAYEEIRNEYVEIYIQRAGTPKKSQKGGYFQDMSKLTIPYRYFAYVLDNNLVSDTIKQNDSPRTQFGKPAACDPYRNR